MKRRLLASLLSVVLLITNLGISSYATEADTDYSVSGNFAVSGNEIVEEEEVSWDEEVSLDEEISLDEEMSQEEENVSKEVIPEITILEEGPTIVETPEIEITDGGTITNYTQLAQALENGGTYTLSGSINTDRPGSDIPLIVKKDVVLSGGSISLSYAGILLGANLTINDTELIFSNAAYKGIFANGHDLSLSDVTIRWDLFDPFSIAAGGIKNNEAVTNSAISEGSGADIVLNNVTFNSSKDENVYIYAGHVYNVTPTTGEGAAQTISNAGLSYPVNITVGNTSGSKITLFARGASYTGFKPGNSNLSNRYYDKITVSNECTSNSNVNFYVQNPVSFNNIDGATGIQNVGATLNVAPLDVNEKVFAAKNLGGIKLDNKNISPAEVRVKLNNDGIGSFLQAAKLSVPQGTILDISDMGYSMEIGSLSGGGKMILGLDQMLTINGEISGQTGIAIGSILGDNNDVGGSALSAQTYIQAGNSTENSFVLIPPQGEDMEFIFSDGEWITTGESSFVIDEKIADISVVVKEATYKVQEALLYNGLEVVWDGEAFYCQLGYIPMTVAYNNSQENVTRYEDEYGYYVYDVLIKGVKYTVSVISSEVTFEPSLPEGTHKFTLTIPAEYVTSKEEKEVSFTIIVGDGESTEPIDALQPTITAQPQDYTYSLNQAADPITVKAQVTDEGSLSYQWYKSTVNSNNSGEKLEGKIQAQFTPDTQKAGDFYYYCEITNTNQEATGKQTAVVKTRAAKITVHKGRGTATVTMADWIYGEEAKVPVAESVTNGTDKVSYTYSGKLQDGTAYGPSLEIPSQAGTYTIKAVFPSNENYEETVKEAGFSILQKEVSIKEVIIEDKLLDETKDAVIEKISFTDKDSQPVELENETDYTAEAEFLTAQAGTELDVLVTVTLLNPNYKLKETTYTAKGNIVDTPKDLWVKGIKKEVEYTGKNVLQEEMEVYHANQRLELNKDYTVKYTNNLKAGTVTITITGKGNYTGTIVETFKILPLDFTKAIPADKVITLSYNGKMQKGTTTVSYQQGDKVIKLKAGTDFTFIYPGTDTKSKDYDSNAFKEAKENPGYQIILRGKGNYSGEIILTQNITKKPLISKLTLTKIPDQKYADITDFEKGIEPEIILKKGKEIIGADQYTVEYKNNKAVGTATVIITAKDAGQYAGSKTATFKITGTVLSKARLTNFKATLPWTIEALTEEGIKQNISLVNITGSGTDKKEEILQEGKHYQAEYQKNTAVGTATLVLKGMEEGGFTGTIKKTFKITGIAMSKVQIRGLNSVVEYIGEKVVQNKYNLVYADQHGAEVFLKEDKGDGTGDYTVSYKNNHKAGTATITFTGINGYTGKVNKSFKISAHNMTGVKSLIKVEQIPDQPYTKGGVLPKPVVTYGQGENAILLEEGVDYSLSYANNKAVGRKEDPKKPPTVIITGKGGYAGKYVEKFNIVQSDLSAEEIKNTATGVIYQNKANICKPAITLYDSNGKKLAAGTDYDKAIKYSYTEATQVQQLKGKEVVTRSVKAGDPVEPRDIIAVGTEITATVKGIKNYKNNKTVNFRYVKSLISKATVAVESQAFTGQEVTLKESDITVKMGKEELVQGRDYEISGYANNIAKGTAKVTLRGLGNYGGEKTVNFKIDSRNMNCTISFDKNGKNVTGSMKMQAITQGAKLTANAFKRVGYQFIGWNTKEDGSGQFYQDKGVFQLENENKTYGKRITLYAQWKAVAYTITYHLNDDKAQALDSVKFPSTYTIEDEIMLEIPYTREGQKFLGWYTDKAFSKTNSITKITSGSVGNINLYAKWEVAVIPQIKEPDTYLDLSKYNVIPNDGKNDAEGIERALRQASINAATGEVNTVYLPAGVYNITPQHAYENGDPGISVMSNTNLIMDNNAILLVEGTKFEDYCVISVQNKENVTIQGGQIWGERNSHTGSGGEGGHGIAVYGSTNVTISGVSVKENWGDGIYLGTKKVRQSDGSQKYIGCNNVTISNCEIYENRRNNIAIVDADNVMIDGCFIHSAHGIAPQCGILNEPNQGSVSEDGINRNITIQNTTIRAYQNKDSASYMVFMTHYNPADKNFTTADTITFKNCTLIGYFGNYSGKNLTIDAATRAKMKGTYVNLR